MKIAQVFGNIAAPYKGVYNDQVGPDFGLIVLLNNILRLAFVVGGLLTFFNLVIAGFQFLNAGGDPKAIEQAWNKIWQSLVGVLILISSFLIAALVGLIFFGDTTMILNPRIKGP